MNSRPDKYLLAAAISAATLFSTISANAATWPVTINPGAGGDVLYGTSNPPTHRLENSGNATVPDNGEIWFKIETAPGFKIKKVTGGGHDITSFAPGPFKYSNAAAVHAIVVTFAALPPTGSFGFQFPSSNPNIPPIFDVSGNYQGVTPTRFQRAYNLDVAVDTAGKIDVMGTIDGITQSSSNRVGPRATGQLNASVGALDMLKGKPTAKYFGSFAGTRDDQAVTLSGNAKIPLALYNVNGSQFLDGTGSYKANIGGVKFEGNNEPIEYEVKPEDAAKANKNWRFVLSLIERTNSQGRKFIAGSGVLTLQNGQQITFAERPVNYSFARGYNIKFKDGLNSLGGEETKVSIGVKQLKMRLEGSTWVVKGGKLSYKFLGQKGAADVLEFGP